MRRPKALLHNNNFKKKVAPTGHTRNRNIKTYQQFIYYNIYTYTKENDLMHYNITYNENNNKDVKIIQIVGVGVFVVHCGILSHLCGHWFALCNINMLARIHSRYTILCIIFCHDNCVNIASIYMCIELTV